MLSDALSLIPDILAETDIDLSTTWRIPFLRFQEVAAIRHHALLMLTGPLLPVWLYNRKMSSTWSMIIKKAVSNIVTHISGERGS